MASPTETLSEPTWDLPQGIPRPSGENSRPASDTVRVLHLINGEHYSGAERVQDLLARRLPVFGYDVGFACLRPGRFPNERQSRNSPLFLAPMRARWDVRPAWRIARQIRRDGYRLLHAHTPRTAMLARIAAKLTGVPWVYHVHSPTRCDSTRGWQNWANTVVERWSVRRADRLICVSASLGEFMQRAGYLADRIRVVPNGVPPVPNLRNRRSPMGTWALGTVALFRPRKGIEVLIQAAARLMREGQPVRLRLVGPFETPAYESQIKSLARDCGLENSIDWVDFTNDVNHELTKMDIFVMPSLFGEGLPMVVLEAMAAGVPVVGTDVEGIPEAVRHGQDGLIVRPNDPDDLARAIAGIIDGAVDWTGLRTNALSRHAERFSDNSMAAGVADVYTEILESAQAK